LEIDFSRINDMLARRQQGIGRSSRQRIEQDRAVFLSGIRQGVTTGAPIAVTIENRDFQNWRDVMSVEPIDNPEDRPLIPRPGHVDLAGALKWGLNDARNPAERASGRATAVTVALGALCIIYLERFGISIASRTLSIGDQTLVDDSKPPTRSEIGDDVETWMKTFRALSDRQKTVMEKLVAEAREKGDTLGGSIQVIAAQVPPGLGSCALPDERLDSRLGAVTLAIPGIKAVEIGAGKSQAGMSGRTAHDQYAITKDGAHSPWFGRSSNLAGGIEGGIANGEPVCLTAWMKPPSTVSPPLGSIDLKTRKPISPENTVRGDVSAIESAGCVLEAEVALELARAHRDRYAGDTMQAAMSAASNVDV
jgi:chorismate synthase